MLFDSVTFWVFLAPVLLTWWFAPHGHAKTLVLLASCVFYAWWNPVFLLLVHGFGRVRAQRRRGGGVYRDDGVGSWDEDA